MSNRTLFFDLETFPIQPAQLAPPIVCGVYAFDDEPHRLLHARDREFDEVLWSAWSDPNALIVAHHAAFEVACVLARWAAQRERVAAVFEALEAGRVKCTMIRQKLIHIARGEDAFYVEEDGENTKTSYALDATCQYWGINVVLDKKSPWRTRFGTLYDKPISQWPPEAVAYAMDDIATRDAYRAQAAEPRFLVDEDNQVRASVALHLASCWGFAVDPEQSGKMVLETQTKLDCDRDMLLEHGFLKWVKEKGVMKLARDKKTAEAEAQRAYAALGQRAPRGDLTEKMKEKGLEVGNIKLDEGACLGSKSPLLAAYTAYGQAGTLMSKVKRVDRAARVGMPIQASFDPLKQTGRTSCKQGEDPDPGEGWSTYGSQLQNPPVAGDEWFNPETGKKEKKWGVRECYVARGYVDALRDGRRPSKVLVSVDYPAGELRTWAQCCKWFLGYSDLIEILNNKDRCPHVELGHRILVAEGATLSLAEAYALKKTDPDRYKDMRGVAKGPGFGLPGGMRAAKLKIYCRQNYGIELTDERAQLLVDVWEGRYRESCGWLDFIKTKVLDTYVWNPFKERREKRAKEVEMFVSKRIRGNVGYCDAANGYFQALLADIAKRAMWEVARECYDPALGSVLFGARIVNFVHDELIVECDREKVTEVGLRVRDIMVEVAERYCPDVSFETTEPAAMYRWNKAAGDPVWKNGELIPWEEK